MSTKVENSTNAQPLPVCNMLSAFNLRIGNYISDIWASEKAAWQVKKFTDKKVWYGNFDCKIENAKPILISKEWLLKFGFVEQSPLGQRTFFAYGNLTVELCAENQNAFYFNGTLLCFHKYIHNLQNIVYSLFGVELNCA